MRYFIGLDNGGTTTKAAIFDSIGHQMASASMETRSITPRPDFVERDMEEMWNANAAVIRKVLEETGISSRDVAGLGVCGHGKGLKDCIPGLSIQNFTKIIWRVMYKVKV